MIALAGALALVSLVLIAVAGILGWTVFAVLRRDIADRLAQLTKVEDRGARLLQELVEAERELRPIVEATKLEARQPARVPTSGAEDRQASTRATDGVAPLPGWLQEQVEAEAERRAREGEFDPNQPTDAVVARTNPWDVSDRFQSEELEQAVTVAEGSKLRADPPPPPTVG